jgi:hypothetical protein
MGKMSNAILIPRIPTASKALTKKWQTKVPCKNGQPHKNIGSGYFSQ